MIIAFCGHRDYIAGAEDEEKVLSFLERIVGCTPCEFFLGAYGNFDSFAYRCAKKFKDKHAEAKIIYITPYLGVKEELARFDLVIYPPLETVPPRYAIAHRNRWIVEQADVFVAYVNRRYGGAYTMYAQAQKSGKRIYNLATGQ